MALRLCLLGLVALMSFELPTGRELDTLGQQGSRWLSDRVADLGHFGSEVERTFSERRPDEIAGRPVALTDPLAEELAVIRADVAFEAAMDRLSIEFRADLTATEATLPVADEAPPRLAIVAEPTPSMTEQAEPSCFDRDQEVIEPSALLPASEPAPRTDRLSTAVKLTRQALSAWASLIPQVAEENQVETR